MSSHPCLKDNESLDVDQTMYKPIIGILWYATNTRLYMMQFVGLLARFQSPTKEIHVHVVKIVFRYLKGPIEFGLWYPRRKYFSWTMFIDKNVNDKKSTSGGPFFLGKCLLSWLSKTKTSISFSTTKVAYIVDASCCTQIICMKQTLEGMQIKYNHPIPINLW